MTARGLNRQTPASWPGTDTKVGESFPLGRSSGGRQGERGGDRPTWRPGQSGLALLEVLIASIVVGITVLGVSLMLVRATAFTSSQGTNQAELYYAEQKLERLRVLGFTGVRVLGPTDTGASDGCSTDIEPCYSETIQGGVVSNAQPQSFTRTTCVDFVSDDGPPYPANCPSTPPSQPACWSDASHVTCTKRIRVTVQPLNQRTLAGADPITIEMIVVNPPPASF
jgi:type II secretory pathway pseudopilin PulG